VYENITRNFDIFEFLDNQNTNKDDSNGDNGGDEMSDELEFEIDDLYRR